MLVYHSCDVMLPNLIWKVFDDDGIITGGVYELIAFLIASPNAEDHVLREDDVDEDEGSYQIGLDHETLIIVDFIGDGELVENIDHTLCV